MGEGIAPSDKLRKWVHEDKDGRWAEFTASYEKELHHSKVLKNFIEEIRDQSVVTLLYAAKDEKQNHAIILKNVLEETLNALK